mgnify:CR=1 FL=1
MTPGPRPTVTEEPLTKIIAKRLLDADPKDITLVGPPRRIWLTEYIGELPEDCKACGEKCSKAERAICLRELNRSSDQA